MRRHLEIVQAPIDEARLIQTWSAPLNMGAVIRFLGVVRESEAGQAIQGLEYEVYRQMAEHQFEVIFKEIEKRWPIDSVRLVHRVGFVRIGEPSLWVEVIGPHRGEAFAACQFLIDEMKRIVPIWKKTIQ